MSNWEAVKHAPRWVSKSVGEIYKKHGGSSLPESYFILKGKHFVYRISFAGQGGSIEYIQRKKR